MSPKLLLVTGALLAGILPVLPDATSVDDGVRAESALPNVVVIFTDDQGYGDLSCQGHPTIRTPRIDALAQEGLRLTQFYVPAPLCSPSRTALLTGCYPKRVGMHDHVIFPQYDYGLHTDEVTLADLLREKGYATGCFGKWHLGHRPGLLPNDQGFDYFFGVPYSNDMSQFHRPTNTQYEYRLPLMRQNAVIEWEPDQHLLTRRYTAEVIEFIEEHRDRPFFVYLPHSMPHLPIYASPEFEGKSAGGRYGDAIEEIDWSVGELVDTLERLELLENTLIVFSSDNGPRISSGHDGGSAGPLRGGKGTNWEGGQRVPFIAHWPRMIAPGGVSHAVVTAMDLLPTVAALVGAPLPEPKLDGRDVSMLLTEGAGASLPERSFLYYAPHGELAGVRRGPWKLLLDPLELYHLEHDVSERRDVAEAHPELVEELRALAIALDEEIESSARPVLEVEEQLFDPKRQ